MRFVLMKAGAVVNTIIADEAFCKAYCEKHGMTYERVDDPAPADPVPTEFEQLRADVDFIAMMTGVDL